MQAIKEATLGGPMAAILWNTALNALHAYAQQSDCLAGNDVVAWFSLKSDEYRAALTARYRSADPLPAVSGQAKPTPEGGERGTARGQKIQPASEGVEP
jgi:hypothetical protein